MFDLKIIAVSHVNSGSINWIQSACKYHRCHLYATLDSFNFRTHTCFIPCVIALLKLLGFRFVFGNFQEFHTNPPQLNQHRQVCKYLDSLALARYKHVFVSTLQELSISSSSDWACSSGNLCDRVCSEYPSWRQVFTILIAHFLQISTLKQKRFFDGKKRYFDGKKMCGFHKYPCCGLLWRILRVFPNYVIRCGDSTLCIKLDM